VTSPVPERSDAATPPSGVVSARSGGVFLVVGALGVVFGDIGTSPLYTMTAVFSTSGQARVATAEVYGATSTLIWSMAVIVSLLYVRLLMRTDNDGEGGLLALVALLRRNVTTARAAVVVTMFGMAGAAMFLGDSVITPAISVLSAAEGLEIARPSLASVVLPVALLILAGVFVIQKFGTGSIARFYGPIMLAWFLALAVTGAVSVARTPAALQVLSPHWVWRYFATDPLAAFLSLGAIVLAVTGAEALYADLGHFGRKAIARAWAWIVFPALTITYVGEAAAVVRTPAAATSPFFALIPSWALWPAVVLATLATIIASQAVISGAYTVVHQAAGLGLLPPLRTLHTSRRHFGQIYVPAVNTLLAVAVLVVVLVFRTSSSLASAYGVAVTSTISVTTSLYLALMWRRHHRVTSGIIAGSFALLVVLGFLLANVPKILTGGWLPLGIGLALRLVMSTWWSGNRRVEAGRHELEIPLVDYLHSLSLLPGAAPHRVPGTAIFLCSSAGVTPMAMRTMIDQNHVLHEVVVLLSWRTSDSPTTATGTRLRIEDLTGFEPAHHALGGGIVSLDVTFGYSEHIDPIKALREAPTKGNLALGQLDEANDVYFVSLPVAQFDRDGSMHRWRQVLFLAIRRVVPDPVDLLDLPRERTILIGHVIGL
jgi:KUP system potassium uptake protein